MVRGIGRWLSAWLTCLLCLLAPMAQAGLQVFLKGADPRDVAELQESLRKEFAGDSQIQLVDAEDKSDVVVVLGADSLPPSGERRRPMLVLEPSPSALELQKQDSAVYWAPSLAAQLALTRFLLPATNRVGMLSGNKPEDESWLRVFRQYAAQQSIDVRIVPADTARLARQVAELAVGCDVLMAQPDARIYNRDTIRLILLSAYRQNRVLIGPSPAFVRAGALASLYASSARIAEGVAFSLRQYVRNGHFPPPYRLKQFSVSLNVQVAKSLGLTVPAANELERMIRFEELPTWP